MDCSEHVVMICSVVVQLDTFSESDVSVVSRRSELADVGF